MKADKCPGGDAVTIEAGEELLFVGGMRFRDQ